MKFHERAISTWFGSGYFPFASGTVGTAATIPLVILLWWVGSVWLHAAAALGVLALGIWAARGAEQQWGRKDPGQVVVDETAGFLVATLALPPTGVMLVASFFVFRLMDIVKPWPARRLESLPGSWGIMLDDIMAGIYANLVVQAAIYLVGRFG